MDTLQLAVRDGGGEERRGEGGSKKEVNQGIREQMEGEGSEKTQRPKSVSISS